MKKKRNLLVLALIAVLVMLLHICMRPTLKVTFNGSYLTDTDIRVVRGSAVDDLYADDNGLVYLSYSDLGKQLIILPNPSVEVDGALDGAVIKVSIGGNVATLIDR